MKNAAPLLNRIQNVGYGLSQTTLGKVMLDPGVLFSAFHLAAFSKSPSPEVQAVGVTSLLLTAGIVTVRNYLPDLNQRLAVGANKVTDKLKAPKLDSIGFPLFANGLVLGCNAVLAAFQGDIRSSAISGSFSISNVDKGSAMSSADWRIENIANKIFEKTGQDHLVDNPPRALKYSLYLPEAWAASAAAIVAFTNPDVVEAVKTLSFNTSSVLTIVGGALASVGVVAAATNNGNNTEPAIQHNKVLSPITNLSDRLENAESIPSSDQVISRRFIKYGGTAYVFAAAASLDPILMAGQACTVMANSLLERMDRQRQLQALGPTEVAGP